VRLLSSSVASFNTFSCLSLPGEISKKIERFGVQYLSLAGEISRPDISSLSRLTRHVKPVCIDVPCGLKDLSFAQCPPLWSRERAALVLAAFAAGAATPAPPEPSALAAIVAVRTAAAVTHPPSPEEETTDP
jgi:hypothetical protein